MGTRQHFYVSGGMMCIGIKELPHTLNICLGHCKAGGSLFTRGTGTLDDDVFDKYTCVQ